MIEIDVKTNQIGCFSVMHYLYFPPCQLCIMTDFIRTTVSMPKDLKGFLESKNISVSQLLQDAARTRMQESVLPDWYYSDELPRKEEVIRFIRGLENSDEDVKAMQFYYHRLTSEFDLEDPKVESLKGFIADVANVNHPEYSEVVRKALEHDAKIRDEIFGDSGLMERKEQLQGEIEMLRANTLSEQRILSETVRKLNSQITDNNLGIAFQKDRIEKAENELKSLEDQAYKTELKLGEYGRIEKVLDENASLRQKISELESEINNSNESYQARIAELKVQLGKLQAKYDDTSKGFVSLNQASTVYLFKMLARKMKKIHSGYGCSSYKVIGNDTYIKVPAYSITEQLGFKPELLFQ